MGKTSRRKRKTTPLTEEQAHEFLRIVRDDLLFLQSLNYERPSRTDFRLASAVLRRLLHEGMYQAAWKIAGFEGEQKISATDLQTMIKDVPDRYIHYAYAGGATTEGAHHKGYLLLVVPRDEAKADGHEETAKRVSNLVKLGIIREFSLAEFCQSPSVVSGKAAVSRIGVIRYVANKLGGVHWDNSRGNWTDAVGGRHRLLDEDHIIVGRLPASLYEVVSIAQAISSSKDTGRLVDQIEVLAPEQAQASNVLRFREGRIGKYADLTFNVKDDAEEIEGNKKSR